MVAPSRFYIPYTDFLRAWQQCLYFLPLPFFATTAWARIVAANLFYPICRLASVGIICRTPVSPELLRLYCTLGQWLTFYKSVRLTLMLIDNGKEMKLSDGEKLILFMLSEIYEKLKVDKEIDPKFIIKAIHSGHLWAIRRKYYGIYDGFGNNNEEIVKDVVAILVMWDVMEAAYERLSVAEKNELRRQTGLTEVRFGGFDANTEERHYGVLTFLIDEMDEFPTFKGRDLNTRQPVLESYTRMLRVFKAVGHMLSGRSFNANELIQILNARRAAD